MKSTALQGAVQEVRPGRQERDVHSDRGGDEGRDIFGDHEQLPNDGRSAKSIPQGAASATHRTPIIPKRFWHTWLRLSSWNFRATPSNLFYFQCIFACARFVFS